MKKLILRFVTLSGIILATALPALAQVAVGMQIYWNGDRPYYYDDTYHQRHYITTQEAQEWYRHRDPDYYREHQRDWHSGNYDQWDNQWRHDHERQNREYQHNYGSGGNNYGQ